MSANWNVMYTNSPFQEVASNTCTVTGKDTVIKFSGPKAIPMAEGYAKYLNDGPTIKIVPVETFRVPFTNFQMELKKLINRFSVENASDTPDSILASYLVNVLAAFNAATNERRKWYQKESK